VALAVKIPGGLSAESEAELRKRLPGEVELDLSPEPSTDCEILVAGRPDAEQLDASARLHTLIIPWAGLPPSTRELLLERPHLAVHNLHHNAAPAAELALSLLLAAAKGVVPLDRDLRRGDWTGRYESYPSLLLEGRRALILGYGAIGRRLARSCAALGMEVDAVRRRPGQVDEAGPARVHGPEALRELLPGAAALLLSLPHTEKTESVIGEAELALLPPDAVLVNISRGPVLCEKALYEALSAGSLGGAGLDVWWRYPTSEEDRNHTAPSAYAYQDLDKVVLSPHRGGAYGQKETERRRMAALAATLRAAAAGEPLPHPVDPAEGY